MIQKKQPIFYLLGFQRSGTTILCHLLDKHPEVICLNEPELSKRIVYKQFDVISNTNHKSIKRNLKYFSISNGDYLRIINDFINGRLSEGEFINDVYRLFSPNSKTRICGAKEVLDLTSDKYHWLQKLLRFHANDDIKYIFIERDIKSVVSSFIKLGFFTPNKRKINNWNMKVFAKKYMKSINNAYKNLPGDRTLYLRFEDITKNPKSNIKQMFDFLGVDSSGKIIDRIINTPSRGIQTEYKGSFNTSKNWEDFLNIKQIAWLDELSKKKKRIL